MRSLRTRIAVIAFAVITAIGGPSAALASTPDAPDGSSVTVSSGDTATSPTTGGDSAALMGAWIGGGVLLLGGLAVTVLVARRQRQDA